MSAVREPRERAAELELDRRDSFGGDGNLIRRSAINWRTVGLGGAPRGQARVGSLV